MRKTLARDTSFRPIEAEDVGYVWAAYRKGLKIPEVPDGLQAVEFRERFGEFVTENFDGVWTMFAGERPVGLAFGFWSHPKANTMILNWLAWFPWASPRTRVECAVRFFEAIRREIPMIGFCKPQDKPFFVALMQHGIIRQVGTSNIMLEDAPASVYETRWTQ